MTEVEHSYRCPRCGSTDLRVEVVRVHSLNYDGTLDVADGPCLVDSEVNPNAKMLCNNGDCEFSDEARHFAHSTYDLEHVTRSAPRWAWDMIDEALKDAAEYTGGGADVRAHCDMIGHATRVMINACEDGD